MSCIMASKRQRIICTSEPTAVSYTHLALLERGVRHVSIGSDQQIIAAGCKALLEAAYH